MKKLLLGLAILAALLIVAAIALPSLVPSSVYKQKIETQLSSTLGRDVRVIGDIKLSILPVIKANAGRVEIDNPDGFSAQHFASMDAMSAQVKLLPLLSKRVEIAAFTLKSPTINLEKNAAGQVNWAFGGGSEQPQEVQQNAGPFKRDGRYGDLEAAIGKFTLEQGNILYSDAVKGESHSLEAVNINFALPNLSSPLAIDGELTYNGMPAQIDLSLDSLRGFLDGKEAPVALSLTTDFAQIETQGRFLAGEEIAFVVDINGDISDAAKLMSLSPTELPYSDLAQSIKLSGHYAFDGKVLSAKGANISAKGNGFDVGFKGDATLADTPVLEGRVTLDAQDIKTLAKALDQDIKGLELISAAVLSADLKAQGKGFAANNIKADIKGDALAATFAGSGAFAEAITANGAFTANAGSVQSLLKALDLDIPQAAAVQSADVKGALIFDDGAITLSGLDVSSSGGVATGRYAGAVKLIDGKPDVDGTFTARLTSLGEFSNLTGMDIPYADAIGQIDVQGAVLGSGETVSLSDLVAKLSGGQLNGDFTGTAGLENGLNLNGAVLVDVASLRALAATTGSAALPSSTNAGPIYERFSVSGQIEGTPEQITFEQASISLDHLKGSGAFTVDMSQTKPVLGGTLNMEGLDLRPYMAANSAQKPSGKIEPWSEAPIDMSPLNAVDGNFTLTTPNIITNRMSFGQSDIAVTLANGTMSANLPNISLYGGLGQINAVLDASSDIPSFDLDMGLSDLNSNAFLSAAAGFTNATGETGTSLKLSGQGRSLSAIMKSLLGSGDFKVVDGQISGVDLNTLLSGLDQAITSRTLPGGIGSSYQTKFDDIAGLFTMENGVAKIEKFSFEGPGVLAIGSGEIDLGNQNIDFNLRPRRTDVGASDLAAFGIPIKAAGGFGNVKIGLDTDMLGQIAQERAKAKAQSLIKDQVGGELGDVLGSVLGGNQTPPQQTPTQTPSGQIPSEPAQQPQTPEDAVTDLLGGILGGNKTSTSPPKPAPEPEQVPEQVQEEDAAKDEEPNIEDALKDLFGR